MTQPRTMKLPGFEGVNAGQTATLRMPRGRTFHQLYLSYTGVTLAQISELRLVINGDVHQRWKGADFLDSLNQFEGRSAAAGILTIDFDRYNMRTRDAEEITAIGTGDPEDTNPVTSLTLEIDIDAAASAPAFTATARSTRASSSGLIKRIRNFVHNPTAAGEFDIVDLPRGPLMNRVVLQSALITRVQIERDDTIIFDRTKALNELLQVDGIRVPNSDWFVIDPTEFGNGADGIITDGVQDFRIRLFLSGGGEVRSLVEYLDGVGE